ELTPHQLRHDPATAMAREHADPRDPTGPKRSAGNGQLEWIRRHNADSSRAVERVEDAIGGHPALLALVVVVVRAFTERRMDEIEASAKVVPACRPDFDHCPFSKGESSSIARRSHLSAQLTETTSTA